jgi:predicted DNA binding CopG/RHH family protein
MKIDVTEKSLAEAVERGEWKTAGVTKREQARYESYAKATLRKGRRLTIMLSKRDFDAIQARALGTGVSCETLASVVLHKYATGRFRERAEGHRDRTDSSRESTELIVPRLVNLHQAAKYLGCSFWTIRDYVLQGLIPVVHLPPLRARPGARQRQALRRVVLDRADLDKFVETRRGRAGVLPS